MILRPDADPKDTDDPQLTPPGHRRGAVLAHNTSAEDLQRRVAQDPFVAADVVTADIVEIAAGQADDRLKFLLD
ncbi:hypothetical protein [Nocardia sp. NPDC059228]|uniref:hypothetical protein n=1 Tax=Nocardia sp. NPDC059228 TaxID=3346777 RepID=UPI003679A98A